MSDTMQANGINIRIWKFYESAETVRDAGGKDTGKIVVRDYVAYGPPHLYDRQVTNQRVDRILRATRQPEGSKNIALDIGWKLKEVIEPLYNAWKRGEQLPETGTPLVALNFLRVEDAEILKRNGVRTVEELAGILDSHIDTIKVPGIREKRVQAKRWLASQDVNVAAAKIAANEQEIADLKTQMAELLAAMPKPEAVAIDENGERIPAKRGTLSAPKAQAA